MLFFFSGLSPWSPCLTGLVWYVTRYRSYPLRRRSSVPLVLSDGPIPSPNHVSLPANRAQSRYNLSTAPGPDHSLPFPFSLCASVPSLA